MYIPDRGDIVWLNFNPTLGHEQSGRRPALIVSSKRYNSKSDLALVCPITSQVKGYPFEVLVKSKDIQGVILTDQIRTINWKIRKTKKICSATESVITNTQEYLKKLISD